MNLKKLNDIQLFELIQKNHPKAFKELYNRHWEELYYAAYKRLADELCAEELVQETFVNLYVKKESLKITTTLIAYMHTVLKYKVIDEVRKRISAQTYLTSLSHQPRGEINDVNYLYERKELKEQFTAFTASLPKRCREVFILKRAEFSNKEIAQKLNIAEKTVEGHVSRAFRLLKVYFNDVYFSNLILFIQISYLLL